MSVIKFGAWQDLSGNEVANSTDPVGDGGLVHIKTQTIGSGVSSVSVTDVFSSTYDNYKVVVNINDSSTNTAVTWSSPQDTSTTYQYSGYYLYLYQANTSLNFVGNYTSSYIQVGFTTSALTGFGGNIVMDILRPNMDAATFIQSTASTYYVYNIWGRISPAATPHSQLTGFTLGLVSGTMTGGNIRVYGYRN